MSTLVRAAERDSSTGRGIDATIWCKFFLQSEFHPGWIVIAAISTVSFAPVNRRFLQAVGECRAEPDLIVETEFRGFTGLCPGSPAV